MAVAERILWLKPVADRRSDESLVRAAKMGSSEAASALIERYYPRVKGFVTYLNGSSANAEDLTQEVFTRALGALSRFNGSYKVEPWLLRIARNLSIDEGRRRTASPTDPTELTQYETAVTDADPAWERISSDLAAERVKTVLQRLPDRQRAVLILREIEDMSYADIAEVMGTNIRGAEATLRRARQRFRMEMINVENDEELRAVCRKTLRSIAADAAGVPASLEAVAHLRRCGDCAKNVSAIRKADKAFSLLPPIGLASPSWLRETIDAVRAGLERPRKLAEQSAIRFDLAGSFGAVLQSAASLVVVAAVSIAPVSAKKAVQIAHASQAPPAPIVAMASLDPAPEPSNQPAYASLAVAAPSGTTEAAPPAAKPKTSILIFTSDALRLNLSLEGILIESDLVDIAVDQNLPSAALTEAIGDISGLGEEQGVDVKPPIDIIPNATLVTATVSPMTLPRRRFSRR